MISEKLLQDLINEVHEINKNIVRLLERDKVQNKRIDDIEEEIKHIKKDQQDNREHLYKIIGFVSCVAFLIPIILRLMNL